MSDEELQIKEAPLKEKPVDDNRLNDYLGMVNPPNKEKATNKAIQEIKKEPKHTIQTQRSNQQQEPTKEDLESRKNLMEDYMSVAVPKSEINEIQNNSIDTRDYIKNLETQHEESQNTPPTEMEALKPKTLTKNRLAEYLGYVDPDTDPILEDFEDFVEETPTLKHFNENEEEFRPVQHVQHHDKSVTNNYSQYEFQSYIGTEFEKYLKQLYGSKKAALLDRMFIKQHAVLETLEGTEIENDYYKMVDKINTNYDRNTKLQNFKNVIKFFTKFYHYLKFKEDELLEEEEDLMDVIKDIYTILNRTTTQ